MADETENLGLYITARNETQAAFNEVNNSIAVVNKNAGSVSATFKMSTDQIVENLRKVGGGAGEVAKEVPKIDDAAEKTKTAFDGLNVHNARTFGQMANQARNFGTNVLQGDLIGSITSFIGLSVSAFKTFGASLAVATGGITLVIAAVILAINHFRDLAKEQEEQAKKSAELVKDLNDLTLKLTRDGVEKEKQIKQEQYDVDIALLEEKANDEWALENARLKASGVQLADRIAMETDFRDKVYMVRVEGKKKLEIDLAEIDQKYKKKEEEVKETWEQKVARVNAESAQKAREQSAKDAMQAGEERVKQIKKAQEEVTRIKKQISDADLKMQEAEYTEQLKARQAFDQKMKDYNETMKQEMTALFTSIGTAMASGIGKGAEGLKESMKSVLNVVISFVEKLVLANIAAVMATNWWNPAAWAQLAAVTMAFEGAKVAVSAFQTPEGSRRVVPGSSDMAVPIMAHGGETVGRDNGSTSVEVTIKADDDLSRAVAKSLYFHSKRTGQRVDYNAARS
jgi:hypothetical protein